MIKCLQYSLDKKSFLFTFQLFRNHYSVQKRLFFLYCYFYMATKKPVKSLHVKLCVSLTLKKVINFLDVECKTLQDLLWRTLMFQAILTKLLKFLRKVRFSRSNSQITVLGPLLTTITIQNWCFWLYAYFLSILCNTFWFCVYSSGATARVHAVGAFALVIFLQHVLHPLRRRIVLKVAHGVGQSKNKFFCAKSVESFQTHPRTK